VTVAVAPDVVTFTNIDAGVGLYVAIPLDAFSDAIV
jgi:hypothetical protein